MPRTSNIIVGALLAALVTSDASAQWNVARFGTARKTAYVTFGLDPAFVSSAGLAGVGTIADHDVQLSADVGIVTAKVDVRDFRSRLGLKTSLLSWRSVQLTGSATAIARGTDNAVYRGINFGADLTAALGVYRPGWFAAVDFGKDKAIITHVTHTEWYRSTYYADAKNGWYLDAGGTLRSGIAGGMTVGMAELMLRAGVQRTEDYRSLMPPMYASVGVGFGY